MNLKRTWMCLGVLGAVILSTGLRSAEDAKRAKGVFSEIRVGQPVSLKEDTAGFTITFFEPELPQSHKIVEVGSDYVTVRDLAEVSQSTIPVYSIKAIVMVKAKSQ